LVCLFCIENGGSEFNVLVGGTIGTFNNCIAGGTFDNCAGIFDDCIAGDTFDNCIAGGTFDNCDVGGTTDDCDVGGTFDDCGTFDNCIDGVGIMDGIVAGCSGCSWFLFFDFAESLLYTRLFKPSGRKGSFT